MKREEPQRFYSRPADRSLAAYRQWLEGIGHALGLSPDDAITEAKWEASWRRFWEEADKGVSQG